MATDNSNITFKGDKMTILGNNLAVGDSFPSIKLTATDMSDLDDSFVAGKVSVIASVPSLDTPVCSIETKTFNEDIAKVSPEVNVLVVSMDLPFAQKRWCGAEGVEQVVTASDYKYRGFGESTGTHIQEWGMLCRAVFVTDTEGKIQHVEYVDEISQEPNYSAIVDKVKELTQ